MPYGMNLAEFKQTLLRAQPPKALSPALKALWWDAKGNWDKAHDFAQQKDDSDGAWVHAYLHRKEGDLANAGYWYRQADKPVVTQPLKREWTMIVRRLLERTA